MNYYRNSRSVGRIVLTTFLLTTLLGQTSSGAQRINGLKASEGFAHQISSTVKISDGHGNSVIVKNSTTVTTWLVKQDASGAEVTIKIAASEVTCRERNSRRTAAMPERSMRVTTDAKGRITDVDGVDDRNVVDIISSVMAG